MHRQNDYEEEPNCLDIDKTESVLCNTQNCRKYHLKYNITSQWSLTKPIYFHSVGILVFGGDHYRNLSHIVDPIGYEIMHLVNYPVETAGSDFWGSCAGE